MRHLPNTFTAHRTFADAVEAQEARVWSGAVDPRDEVGPLDPGYDAYTPGTTSRRDQTAAFGARNLYPAIARAERVTREQADARRAELLRADNYGRDPRTRSRYSDRQDG